MKTRVGISSNLLRSPIALTEAKRMQDSVGRAVRFHPSASQDTAMAGIDRRIWLVAVHITLINAYIRLVDR